MQEEVTVQKDAVLRQMSSEDHAFDHVTIQKHIPYEIAKRGFDLICAAVSIVLLCIPMLVVALLVCKTSPGGAIFKQKRVGKSGKFFTIFKFRTMVDGADDLKAHLSPRQYKQYLHHRKLKEDPRVTPLGAKLRKTSLDELPQLFNILCGQMSFIGPRPLLEEEIDGYGSAFPVYKEMKPGLTGLWQIESRSRTLLSERAKMDRAYYLQRSFWLDLKIFFKTFQVVLSKKGAC